MDVGIGSVNNHTRWVARAIHELGHRFLKWPDDDQQTVISDCIEGMSGLPLCIGSGDGSHVHQMEEPRLFGYMYCC